jgi:hypothetical protein
VYTTGNQALVEISEAAECVYLSAVYQVHIRGYAHRFSTTHIVQYPSTWNISLANHPTFNTYVKGFYHHTWFLTIPVMNYRSNNWCMPFKRGHNSLTSLSYIGFRPGDRFSGCHRESIGYDRTYEYLSIEHFSCQTRRSILYVHDGLSPTITGHRQRFECNHQYEPIPVGRKHKFTHVDLQLDVLDPSVVFTMKLIESNISQQLLMTEIKLDETISSHIVEYYYDKPTIYYSIDSYLSLTVTSFDYNGPQQNVMADHVHQLAQPHGQTAAYLPKGRYSSCRIDMCVFPLNVGKRNFKIYLDIFFFFYLNINNIITSKYMEKY